MFEFHYSNPYGWDCSSSIGFYYIRTRPQERSKNKLISVSGVNTCREYFIKGIREQINNAKGAHPLFVKRAYALISVGRAHKSNAVSWQTLLNGYSEKSLYIINSFEKEHGWPLTKIYPVKCTNEGWHLPLIFFSGPKRWTRSPYLMSIWTLMIRLGRNQWLPKNLMELGHEDLIRQLLITGKGSTGDGFQIGKTMRSWDLFMDSYKELFGDQTRKEHWSVTPLNGFSHRPEGILKLITGTTHHLELKQKWQKIVKEAKVRL
jgi:hypothetical protein